jgi:hypothetical protein
MGTILMGMNGGPKIARSAGLPGPSGFSAPAGLRLDFMSMTARLMPFSRNSQSLNPYTLDVLPATPARGRPRDHHLANTMNLQVLCP